MIFWSMQKSEVWEEAKQLGYLEGKEQFAMYPEEYKWMMCQMSAKLGNYKGEYQYGFGSRSPICDQQAILEAEPNVSD